MNTLLIGARACGKTTVGRLLAARRSCSFVDLDDRVLRRLGEPTVRTAWDRKGESAWREAEAAALLDVLTGDAQVIALGGGTPTIPQASRAIESARARGTAQVIYLSCDTDELVRRLQRDAGDRPSLTDQGLLAEVQSVVAAREPVYRRLADVCVDTTARSPEVVVDEIITRLNRE